MQSSVELDRRWALRFALLAWQACKAHIFAAPEFRHQDDLAGVVGEMLDDVEDGLKSGHTEPLDDPLSRQIARRQSAENAARLHHRLFESGHQNAAWDGSEFSKFLVTLADVRRAAQAGDDPLAHVPRKVEHQVPHTV